MNVVYRAMIDRLGYDENQPERPRAELDRALEVDLWWHPGQRTRPTPAVNRSSPHWWHGDNDASQSFLAAMGVKI